MLYFLSYYICHISSELPLASDCAKTEWESLGDGRWVGVVAVVAGWGFGVLGWAEGVGLGGVHMMFDEALAGGVSGGWMGVGGLWVGLLGAFACAVLPVILSRF